MATEEDAVHRRPPGRKREQVVSIEDVAQRAGVSVATVSRALRGLPNVAPETRLRVEAAARDLDYVQDPSAARLAAGRTRTLGIVMPGLGRWYGSRIMAAVHDVWSHAGYELLAIVIADQDERERFLRDLPFRKRVDGLLVLDVPLSEDEYGRLLDTDVAVVTAGARSVRVPSVGIDDRRAARVLVEHLVQLGHRDLALLRGTVTEPFRYAGPTDRMLGVTDALRAAGIELPEHRVAVIDWSPRDAAAAMQHLLDADDTPPTAVVCFSDEIAIAAMGVLRRADLAVPRDVSVVGFDDHDLAAHVGLTTIHQPIDTLGRRAAGLLLRRLADPEDRTRHEVLPTRLVVRESTAPPRDTGTPHPDDQHATDRRSDHHPAASA